MAAVHVLVGVVVTALIAAHVYTGQNTWLHIAISIAVLASASRSVRYGIHHVWLWIGRTLGRIISPILLTALYVFILLPSAMLSRWLGPPSNIRTSKSNASLFVDREQNFESKDFRQLW